MITSQYLMIVALGCIAIFWLISWATGHRTPGIHKVFAALCLQALAAILLSFSTGNLLLSLLLAAIILGATLLMIQSVPNGQKHLPNL